MAFKSAPRIDDDFVPKPSTDPDVVPVSEDQAKYASGTSASAMDKQHAAALARAAQVKDDSLVDVGSKDVPAKYKIEVFFGPNRTHQGPNVVSLKFWESGRRLHGGGDDLMFMCRNSEEGKEAEGCQTIFSSDFVRHGIAICPKCQRAINAEKLTRGLVGNKTSRQLAKELAFFWRKLGGNCDIYLKFDRTDIRYRMVEREKGPQKARELKGLSIYPLRNILADTGGGAELENRIFAFLTA